jgi:hypothetical protein
LPAQGAGFTVSTTLLMKNNITRTRMAPKDKANPVGVEPEQLTARLKPFFN